MFIQVNPDSRKNAMGLVLKCLQKALVPTPNYQGRGTAVDFIYVVVAPKGITSYSSPTHGTTLLAVREVDAASPCFRG